AERGDFSGADAGLLEAADAATAAGHARALASVRVRQVGLYAATERVDEIVPAIDRAEAAIEQVTYDAELAVQSLVAVAAAVPQDQPTRMLALGRRAAAILETAPHLAYDEYRGAAIAQSSALLALGRPAEATAAWQPADLKLEELLDGAPPQDVPGLLNDQGVARYFRGDLPGAVQSFEAALVPAREQGDSALVLAMLGNIVEVHRETDAAAAALSRSEELLPLIAAADPDHPGPQSYSKALSTHAAILVDLGRFEDAAASLDEAVAEDESGDPTLRLSLAAARFVSGQREAAAEHARAVLAPLRERGLPLVDATALAAACKLARGEVAEAIVDLDVPAILVEDRHGLAHRTLAAALHEAGRDEVRVAALRKAASELPPAEAALWRALGDAVDALAPIR
ncbi:MAG: hypothetical protein AAF721_13130, partial [Myxococcota bacterium]